MMDDKGKCRNVKSNMYVFYLITRKNVAEKHEESLSFDYAMYIGLR